MEEITRRLAIESDLQAVYAIYTDKTVVPYLGYDNLSAENFREIFRDLLADGVFFVVELNGVIAGFYKATRYSGRTRHVVHLGTLAVAPQYQGQGIAGKMLIQAMEILGNSGVRRIQLIVESDNPRALAFYKRFGFEVEGTLRNFYKRADEENFVDDYIMSKIFEQK